MSPLFQIAKSSIKTHSKTPTARAPGKDMYSETQTGALTESIATVMTLTCVFPIVSIVALSTGSFSLLAEISSTWLRMTAETASTTTMVPLGFITATLVTTKSSLRKRSTVVNSKL